MKLSSEEISIILRSIKVAACSVIFTIPLSILIGRKLSKGYFLGRFIIETIINIPLVLPPIATGFILLMFFRTNGFLGRLILNLFDVRIIFSFYGAVVASSIVSIPISVRAIRISMENINTNLEEVAATLGIGKYKRFFKIILPLSFPGIISGTVFAFIRSLGEFGATITLAGAFEGEGTLSIALWNALQEPGNESYAYKLLLICIIISMVALLCSEFLIKILLKKKRY
jgi:molybdate transport system permease protein